MIPSVLSKSVTLDSTLLLYKISAYSNVQNMYLICTKHALVQFHFKRNDDSPSTGDSMQITPIWIDLKMRRATIAVPKSVIVELLEPLFRTLNRLTIPLLSNKAKHFMSSDRSISVLKDDLTATPALIMHYCHIDSYPFHMTFLCTDRLLNTTTSHPRLNSN